MTANLEEAYKRELQWLYKVLERKNLQLDALGMVWCDGGCPGGVHRYNTREVTEEHVEFLEKNAARARRWIRNRR